jgi:hypothetical protein
LSLTFFNISPDFCLGHLHLEQEPKMSKIEL